MFKPGDRVKFTKEFKDYYSTLIFRDDMVVKEVSGSYILLGTIYYGNVLDGKVTSHDNFSTFFQHLELVNKEYNSNLEKELDEIQTMGYRS